MCFMNFFWFTLDVFGVPLIFLWAALIIHWRWGFWNPSSCNRYGRLIFCEQISGISCIFSLFSVVNILGKCEDTSITLVVSMSEPVRLASCDLLITQLMFLGFIIHVQGVQYFHSCFRYFISLLWQFFCSSYISVLWFIATLVHHFYHVYYGIITQCFLDFLFMFRMCNAFTLVFVISLLFFGNDCPNSYCTENCVKASDQSEGRRNATKNASKLPSKTWTSTFEIGSSSLPTKNHGVAKYSQVSVPLREATHCWGAAETCGAQSPCCRHLHYSPCPRLPNVWASLLGPNRPL